MMRRSATGLAMLLLIVVACTREPLPQVPTSTSATSLSVPSRVVPDVVGQNFLEALVAVSPHFQLRGEGRPRVSADVPNGTILSQRPAAGTPVDPNESKTRIWVVMSISPG